MGNKEVNEKQRMWRLAGRYSSFGMELAFCILVPTFIGSWVDEEYATDPYGIGIGILVGLGAAFESIRRLIAYTKKLNL
jgi:F0F1-type ATP synthase assembly protein I